MDPKTFILLASATAILTLTFGSVLLWQNNFIPKRWMLIGLMVALISTGILALRTGLL